MGLPSDYHAPETEPEKLVNIVRDSALAVLLRRGADVICDDTNLRGRYVRDLMKIAQREGAEAKVIDFIDVPLEECIRRDAAREHPEAVGEDVIRGMHTRYLAALKGKPLPVPVLTDPDPGTGVEPYVAPTGAPAAFLVDLDGTLALMNGRSPYDESCVIDDLPNWPVIATVLGLVESGWHPIFMSGRTEACREDTTRWILAHVFNVRPVSWTVSPIDLHMRAVGDQRPDYVVKLELFDRHVRDQFNVRLSIDDRDQVVALWRRLGITCLQCAEGNV
ncbi:MAG: AAA family ATPase [Candidatus Dormibacteria bacterium]